MNQNNLKHRYHTDQVDPVEVSGSVFVEGFLSAIEEKSIQPTCENP